jgi:hypothetical protein
MQLASHAEVHEGTQGTARPPLHTTTSASPCSYCFRSSSAAASMVASTFSTMALASASLSPPRCFFLLQRRAKHVERGGAAREAEGASGGEPDARSGAG